MTYMLTPSSAYSSAASLRTSAGLAPPLLPRTPPRFPLQSSICESTEIAIATRLGDEPGERLCDETPQRLTHRLRVLQLAGYGDVSHVSALDREPHGAVLVGAPRRDIADAGRGAELDGAFRLGKRLSQAALRRCRRGKLVGVDGEVVPADLPVAVPGLHAVLDFRSAGLAVRGLRAERGGDLRRR